MSKVKTAEDKAVELIQRFREHSFQPNPIWSDHYKCEDYHAIQCAIICVNEIILNIVINDQDGCGSFWQDVKSHLKNRIKQ